MSIVVDEIPSSIGSFAVIMRRRMEAPTPLLCHDAKVGSSFSLTLSVELVERGSHFF